MKINLTNKFRELNNNIYHLTNISSTVNILNTNILKLGRNNYISFTRSPNYRISKTQRIALVFDYDLLRNNYKFIETDWFYKNKTNKIYSYRMHGISEFELMCLKPINNIQKYITEIIIYDTNISKQLLDLCNKYDIKISLATQSRQKLADNFTKFRTENFLAMNSHIKELIKNCPINNYYEIFGQQLMIYIDKNNYIEFRNWCDIHKIKYFYYGYDSKMKKNMLLLDIYKKEKEKENHE